ncbi:MAG: site-specific integrase, partial [Nocardioidaceae bacterium]
GEPIGLHWRDVDWNQGSVRIRLQLVSADGVAELGAPKTRSSARLLPIDAETMSVLRLHQQAQERERDSWGEAWSDTGLVFTREDGSALRPDYVTHLFIKFVQRAGLPRIRLHDLRHTNASLALAAGVPMKVVSHRLGHSSLAITSDLYTHVSRVVDQEAAEAIASVLHSPQTSSQKPGSSNRLAQRPNDRPGASDETT